MNGIVSMFELMAMVPLAQVRNWRRLGDGLHRRGTRFDLTELLLYAIGMTVVGLCIWGIILWKRRNDTSTVCDDPAKLFRELCHSHGIQGENQRLLKRLVEAWGMEQPAQIFVTPAAFQIERLPVFLQTEVTEQQVEKLREQLF